jgi:type I site-specific restriction endonuclease
VSCVVLCRPTESEALYRQMVGRGTRLKDGPYKDLIIVDFPWVAGMHSLVKPMELFRSSVSDDDDEVFNEANKMLELPDGPDDLMEAMTMADKVVRERREFQVKARDGRVKYERLEYDPLGVNGTQAESRYERGGSMAEPATDKQVAMLLRNGIAGAESYSKARASILIGKIVKRIEKGLSSYKQIGLLSRMGVPRKIAREMTFEEASQAISQRKVRR